MSNPVVLSAKTSADTHTHPGMENPSIPHSIRSALEAITASRSPPSSLAASDSPLQPQVLPLQLQVFPLPPEIFTIVLSYEMLETIAKVAEVLQAIPLLKNAVHTQVSSRDHTNPLTLAECRACVQIHNATQIIFSEAHHLYLIPTITKDRTLQELVATFPNLHTLHIVAPRCIQGEHARYLIPATTTLAPLAKLESLQHLSLQHRVISSEDLQYLASCPALTSLSLETCDPLPLSSLNCASFLKFKVLRLKKTDLGLRGPGCPQLPNLEVMALDADEFLKFGQYKWDCLLNFPALHTLILERCYIDAHPLTCLTELPQIKCLEFESCAIIDGLQHLSRLKNLQHVRFTRCTGLTREHLRQFKSPPLKCIDFISCNGMESCDLTQCPNLKDARVNFGRRSSIFLTKKGSLKGTTPH